MIYLTIIEMLGSKLIKFKTLGCFDKKSYFRDLKPFSFYFILFWV
jgi:hypothetical protein